MTLFKQHTKDEHAQSLADYLPNGFAWINKNIDTSNLRKLLRGFGRELVRVEEKMNEIISEHDINTTTLLIEEWEATLGIPDECIAVASTLSERRTNILLKLSLAAVSTSEDFEALATMLGISCNVTSGTKWGIFPMEMPIILFSTPKEARFTIVVDFYGIPTPSIFPVTFPFVFGSVESTIVRCLFEKLKPANCQIIYRYN